MDFIISFLTQYGYWGMLLAAFLAGSFFPFSSEAVMVGLMATGLDPWSLMIYGTIGNVLGSVFNYGVGRMGKIEWCMDGVLCLSACVRQCHHHRFGTDAIERGDYVHSHYPRQIIPLCGINLWCRIVYVS